MHVQRLRRLGSVVASATEGNARLFDGMCYWWLRDFRRWNSSSSQINPLVWNGWTVFGSRSSSRLSAVVNTKRLHATAISISCMSARWVKQKSVFRIDPSPSWSDPIHSRRQNSNSWSFLWFNLWLNFTIAWRSMVFMSGWRTPISSTGRGYERANMRRPAISNKRHTSTSCYWTIISKVSRWITTTTSRRYPQHWWNFSLRK